MCCTPPYTKHKTKTKKTKNTTQYVLNTTRHKTKTNNAKNTTQFVLDFTIHKTKTNKTKTHHNLCWTPLYASKPK